MRKPTQNMAAGALNGGVDASGGFFFGIRFPARGWGVTADAGLRSLLLSLCGMEHNVGEPDETVGCLRSGEFSRVDDDVCGFLSPSI